ncbi:monocarboxylate transporter 13-like [Ylistrum balloti]|uniref:monocarboxylate transporter 13-like n=1 Tax=Ylistrum balloti TaxID=509963 RepID=UPI002905809E|nr:monocarboxylate transporter 13-like [Ylistrum balloti]
MKSTGQANKKTSTDHVVVEETVRTDYSHLPIDHGWAYVTVFGCFGVCALIVGTLKSFGVILVELSRRFNVPASVLIGPQCLAGFFHLSLGPVANALSERYSHRLVVFVGGMVAAIGLACTSFVQSVPAFYLTYGVMSGVGFGLCLSPSITFQGFHFQKRRALANGLSASGSGAGSFALPPIIRVLINYYGLGGCLLLVGAFMFHTCVFCSFFRPPSYWVLFNKVRGKTNKTERDDKHSTGEKDTTHPLLENTKSLDFEIFEDGKGTGITSKTESGETCMYDRAIQNQEQFLLDIKRNETSHHLSTSSLPCIAIKRIQDETRPRTESVRINSTQHSNTLQSKELTNDLLFASLESFPSLSGSGLEHTLNYNKRTSEPEKVDDTKKKPMLEWSLLKNSTYLVFIFVLFTGIMGQHSLFNVLPSVANEKSISDEQGAIIVSILGAADLFGRIFFGWLADFGFVKRQTMYHLNLTVFAMVGFITPYINSFIGFCLLSMFLGIFTGGYTGTQIAILADKFGVEKLSSAWGFAAFLASLALLVNPFLAGVIRDVTGSWIGAVVLGASVSAFGSGLLTIEALLIRIRR